MAYSRAVREFGEHRFVCGHVLRKRQAGVDCQLVSDAAAKNESHFDLVSLLNVASWSQRLSKSEAEPCGLGGGARPISVRGRL